MFVWGEFFLASDKFIGKSYHQNITDADELIKTANGIVVAVFCIPEIIHQPRICYRSLIGLVSGTIIRNSLTKQLLTIYL